MATQLAEAASEDVQVPQDLREGGKQVSCEAGKDREMWRKEEYGGGKNTKEVERD